MTICTFAGCNNQRHSHGLCRSHVSQMRRGVPLHPLGEKPPARPCGFPGCDRPHKSGGWCDAHYSQAFRGYTMHPVGVRKPRRLCDFDGCERVHYAKGLCLAHYQQLAKSGRLAPLAHRSAPYGDAGCTVAGCTRKAHARALCTAHYQQWRAGRDLVPIGTRSTDGPKREKKASAGKQARRPKRVLPKGWNRPARPTATVAIAGGVREIGPVPPMPPRIIAAALETLAARDALDLAECLGLVA